MARNVLMEIFNKVGKSKKKVSSKCDLDATPCLEIKTISIVPVLILTFPLQLEKVA